MGGRSVADETRASALQTIVIVGTILLAVVGGLGAMVNFAPNTLVQIICDGDRCKPVPVAALKDQPKVLVFDTKERNVSYSDEFESNAVFVVQELYRRGISATEMPVHLDGTMPPGHENDGAQIAVVHRSAFGTDKELTVGLNRLLASAPHTRFIIFSRDPTTGGDFLRQIQADANLAGRVEFVVFTPNSNHGKDNPWTRPAQTNQLMNVIAGNLRQLGWQPAARQDAQPPK